MSENTPLPFDETLRETVQGVGIPVCEPKLYEGKALEYCVYTYTAVPVGHADNTAAGYRLLVSLHWYLPTRRRPSKRWALCRAIIDMGGTPPTVEDASDGDGQHYVFEFEYLEGF